MMYPPNQTSGLPGNYPVAVINAGHDQMYPVGVVVETYEAQGMMISDFSTQKRNK